MAAEHKFCNSTSGNGTSKWRKGNLVEEAGGESRGEDAKVREEERERRKLKFA